LNYRFVTGIGLGVEQVEGAAASDAADGGASRSWLDSQSAQTESCLHGDE